MQYFINLDKDTCYNVDRIFCTKMIMETDTFLEVIKNIIQSNINLHIKYNLVTFSIYILNVEKGVVKIYEL